MSSISTSASLVPWFLDHAAGFANRLAVPRNFVFIMRRLECLFGLDDLRFRLVIKKLVAVVETARTTLHNSLVRFSLFEQRLPLRADLRPIVMEMKTVYLDFLKLLQSRRHLAAFDHSLASRLARLLLPITTHMRVIRRGDVLGTEAPFSVSTFSRESSPSGSSTSSFTAASAAVRRTDYDSTVMPPPSAPSNPSLSSTAVRDCDEVLYPKPRPIRYWETPQQRRPRAQSQDMPMALEPSAQIDAENRPPSAADVVKYQPERKKHRLGIFMTKNHSPMPQGLRPMFKAPR